MKVVTFKQFGSSDVLEISEINHPTPKPYEILIKVHATALNRCDIIQRKGIYKVPPSNSPILGIEVAGEIVQLGSKVEHLKLGQRVFGYVNGGGYAEYCVQDAGFTIPMPDNWSYEQAAAVAEVFQTANESVFTHGQLKAGETLLMHAGASGVGLAAVQMVKQVGAKVIVTVGNEEKRQACLAQGADYAINYKEQDFVTEVDRLTKGQGVELIVDSVGPDYLARNIECLVYDGRLVLIGLLSGVHCDFNFIPFLDKRIMMKGHNTRARGIEAQREIAQHFATKWWPALADGQLNANVDKVFSLADVAKAHDYMEANQNIGKIVLKLIEE